MRPLSSLPSRKLCLKATKTSFSKSKRAYSPPPTILPHGDEFKVDVKVGSSGHVSLSIRHPPRPSHDGPVIIYLPRGPLGPSQEINPLSSLAFNSNLTIVRVNYRLSAHQPYPIPIHDVLAGYDWTKKHLGGKASQAGSTFSTVSRRRLGVCGELIGGSLAAMLALTECHADRQSISVAALGNPITDWTALFPDAQNLNSASRLTRKNTVSGVQDVKITSDVTLSNDFLTLKSLLALRSKIFHKEAHFFDPFASPMLYFRTPCYDLPVHIPDSMITQSQSDSSALKKDSHESTAPKRRSHKKYPQLNSGLRLPSFRIEVGYESLLRSQAIELVELLRRSIKHGDMKNLHCEEFQKKKKDQFQLVEKEGIGLWGEREMSEIGNWFVEAFG